jgi:hypothetical protein
VDGREVVGCTRHLEDALAVAQSRLREAAGETAWLTHEAVKRRSSVDQ